LTLFIFVSKSGQRQAVRYVIAPEKLVHITPEEAAKQSPDYLFEGPGQADRATAAGFSPEGAIGRARRSDQGCEAYLGLMTARSSISACLTLTKVVPNSAQGGEEVAVPAHESHTRLSSSPTTPLPSVRSAAYGVSYGRRSQ